MNPNQPIIDSEKRFVLSVSGGGQQVIGDLTRHGGMSNTLLEAIVPYSTQATDKLIKGVPDKYTAPETARMLATACYQRARAYAPDDEVFGVSSTGSVVRSEGERPGRAHNIFIAVQDAYRTLEVSIGLKPGLRGREEEEDVAAKCIMVAIKWGCHIFADMQPHLNQDAGDTIMTHTTLAPPHWKELVHGVTSKTPNIPSKAVFSSSFNPPHEGHRNIVSHAAKFLKCQVDLELCINNADKPTLDYTSIAERVSNIQTQWAVYKMPPMELFLTAKPLFFDKSELFPGSVFVVGEDTMRRILDPRYYVNRMQMEEGIDKFVTNGCQFLVYPRVGETFRFEGGSKKLWSVTGMMDDPGYTPSAISSSAIRKGQ